MEVLEFADKIGAFHLTKENIKSTATTLKTKTGSDSRRVSLQNWEGKVADKRADNMSLTCPLRAK